jgi:TPR repeat protein
MRNLLKVVASVVAGLLVGALAVAYWPRMKPPPNARSAVEQPQFVVSPAAAATPTAISTDVARAAPPAEKAATDKLAVALRAGPQSAPTDAAPALRAFALTPTGAVRAVGDEQTARMRAQGLIALAEGDIAAARAFLARAAAAGDARALLVLGDTYDPATLARLGAIGLKGDAAQARAYYARALTAGVAAARQRLAALESPPD